MATQHTHRLLIVAPVGTKRNFLNNWFRDNFDPTGTDWLSIPLSLTGLIPATFYMCDTALTEPQVKQFFQMLKQQTGAEFPDAWDTWTRSQKVTWIRNTAIPWLWNNWQLGLMHVNNDGDWSEHDVGGKLAQVGLQRIGG